MSTSVVERSVFGLSLNKRKCSVASVVKCSWVKFK